MMMKLPNVSSFSYKGYYGLLQLIQTALGRCDPLAGFEFQKPPFLLSPPKTQNCCLTRSGVLTATRCKVSTGLGGTTRVLCDR